MLHKYAAVADDVERLTEVKKMEIDVVIIFDFFGYRIYEHNAFKRHEQLHRNTH